MNTVHLGGGAPTALTGGANLPALVAVDEASVYYTDYFGTLSKVPLAGGAKTTLASSRSSPAEIVVDAKTIHGLNVTMPGSVMKLAK